MSKSSPQILDGPTDDNRICVGVVTGPHGLKGDVKLKSFTESPKDVAAFGPVTDKTGEQSFNIRIISANHKGLVVELSGVRGREAAEAIRGTELYMPRDLLPELAEDEFYFSDLIGLAVEHINGSKIGIVSLVDNYGAGDVMEVNLKDGGTEMFQMSREVVPEIDLKNGRVVINPPAEIFADAGHDKGHDKEPENKEAE
jgi:16S rRNA processing protein RimM